MSILEAIILGVLQGLTEFLPVSSSGHLVLVEQWLQLDVMPNDLQALNVLLHAGTLGALLMTYASVWWRLIRAPFRKDAKHVRQLVLLMVATIPGATAGLLFEEWIALHFQSLQSIGVAFGVTGAVLLLGEYLSQKKPRLFRRGSKPTPRSAFFIGIMQAISLVPGLSRSGLTVSAARVMGYSRTDALDFSFLMVVPIIAGATTLSLSDIATGTVVLPGMPVIAMAIAVSFVSSLAAIMFLRSIVAKHGLQWFAPYLFVVSVATITLSFFQ